MPTRDDPSPLSKKVTTFRPPTPAFLPRSLSPKEESHTEGTSKHSLQHSGLPFQIESKYSRLNKPFLWAQNPLQLCKHWPPIPRSKVPSKTYAIFVYRLGCL